MGLAFCSLDDYEQMIRGDGLRMSSRLYLAVVMTLNEFHTSRKHFNAVPAFNPRREELPNRVGTEQGSSWSESLQFSFQSSF